MTPALLLRLLLPRFAAGVRPGGGIAESRIIWRRSGGRVAAEGIDPRPLFPPDGDKPIGQTSQEPNEPREQPHLLRLPRKSRSGLSGNGGDDREGKSQSGNSRDPNSHRKPPADPTAGRLHGGGRGRLGGIMGWLPVQR